MRIEKVLVPVDFSPPSRLAVNHGIAFARKFRAHLTLLNVVETPATYTFPADYGQLEMHHREQARRMLSALIGPENEDGLDLQIMVNSGNVEEQIAAAIRDINADVVVMGTHGRGLFGRALLGSVTQHLLRKIPVPILTVCHVTRPLAFERILFATDLSEASNPGFRETLGLANETRSTLTILHSVDIPAIAYAEPGLAVFDRQELFDHARVRLQALGAEGSGEKVHIDTLLVEGNAAQAILRAAEEHNADLIVLTVPRKGLIERALLGSTAERVIREAHIPVLSIPAGR